MLREHSQEWGLDPARIGFVGFSAGAGVALATAVAADAGCRPDFAAPIYRACPDDVVVPAGAPPLFLALALDDPAITATVSVTLWNAWQAAGRAAELHIFQAGRHGFGVKHQGLGSDAWMGLFQTWMAGLGLLDQGHRTA